MTSVGVVFGGLSPEHDISILTGLQAARLLTSDGRHDVVCIYWTRAGTWLRVPPDLEGQDFTAPEVPRSSRLTFRLPEGFSERRRMKEAPLDIDVVVNCCHGGPGEDGTLSGLLKLAGIRVTGPSPETSAWMMDKLASAAIAPLAGLDRFGVETIPTAVVTDATEISLTRPWVVKPRFGGSSVGVEVGVDDIETARALGRTGIARGGTIVQTQLSGWSDLQLSVRRFPQLQASAIERPLTAGAVYGYKEKYLAGADGMESAQKELPAVLSEDVANRVSEAAKAIVETVGLAGAPRIDFLYDGNDRLALCEVNTIPGSLALYLWAASGVDRTRVVLDLIDEVGSGPALPPHWSAATDGAALRSANTVASKLQ